MAARDSDVQYVLLALGPHVTSPATIAAIECARSLTPEQWAAVRDTLKKQMCDADTKEKRASAMKILVGATHIPPSAESNPCYICKYRTHYDGHINSECPARVCDDCGKHHSYVYKTTGHTHGINGCQGEGAV